MFRRAIFTREKLLNTHTAFERNVLFLVIIACTSSSSCSGYSALKSLVYTTHVPAEKKGKGFFFANSVGDLPSVPSTNRDCKRKAKKEQATLIERKDTLYPLLLLTVVKHASNSPKNAEKQIYQSKTIISECRNIFFFSFSL